MSDLYLTEQEIKHISGKEKQSAQRRALLAMGYIVKERPDGSFWVPRGQFMDNAKPKKSYHLNLGALHGTAKAS